MKKELSDISEEEINEFYKTISENVKEARSAVKMSQLELSLKLGIKSIAFYSNCENLRYNKHFNLEHIYKISKALDVDMCELINLTFAPKPKHFLSNILQHSDDTY